MIQTIEWIVSLARQINHGISSLVPPLAHVRTSAGTAPIRPMDELVTAYYFRFSAVDRPGVLSKISGVLGQHGISIYSVIQKGRELDCSVPVVMLASVRTAPSAAPG